MSSDLPAADSKTVPRRAFTLDDFDITRVLGDGTWSEVVEAVLKTTKEVYALKVVDKSIILRHKQLDAIKQERSLLEALNHPGIARLYFTFQTSANLIFGLECCPNGDLFDKISAHRTLDLETARFYTAEVVDILEYLRSQKVVHRDLKPENLVLDSRGHLKLIDFGSAKVVQPDGVSLSKTDIVGTADYTPPEALKGCKVSYEADLWALGCVLYQMLVGKPPFKAASEFLTFQKIENLELDVPEKLDLDASDLVKALLKRDPLSRLGAGNSGFDNLRSHVFFKGIDWKSLWSQDAPKLSKQAEERSSCDADLSGQLHSLSLSNT